MSDESHTDDTVEVPRALLNRLVDRVDGLKEELSEYRESNEYDKATIRQDVNEAIEKADTAAEREPTESDESGARDDSMLPIERVIEAGEEGVLEHVTERVERASEIAEHFGEWSSKSPSGLTITEGLRDLLNAVTGERLAWSQVNRACEALEEFTKGAIRFERTRRHGNVLVADPSDPGLRSLLASGG